MPQPPQLLPNGFLAQKSMFKKHLMERIINLFEYTSNLIRGRPATRVASPTEPRDTALGNGEWGRGAQPGKGRG